MTRIVANFRLEITDEIPAECKSLRITITDVYDRWNVSTGGTHQLDRVANVSYGGTSSIFNVFAIVTNSQTQHTVTVTALDAGSNELQTRVLTDVPLRNGYRTNYRGAFFTDAQFTSSFTINDWSEYDTVDF